MRGVVDSRKTSVRSVDISGCRTRRCNFGPQTREAPSSTRYAASSFLRNLRSTLIHLLPGTVSELRQPDKYEQLAPLHANLYRFLRCIIPATSVGTIESVVILNRQSRSSLQHLGQLGDATKYCCANWSTPRVPCLVRLPPWSVSKRHKARLSTFHSNDGIWHRSRSD